MTILSIQSAVAFGYVGNTVALPALQALGHDVCRVDTVAFSNHPGYGRFTGRVRETREIVEILDGLSQTDLPPTCDAILSGYLGRAATALAVRDAVNRIRHVRPEALYVLDPVIGDDQRVFVAPDICPAMRQSLLPIADIVIPNVSELGWLTKASIDSHDIMVDRARALLRHRATAILVTGVREAAEMAVYAIAANGIWRAAAPYRERRFNGTGDLFAALFTGWYIKDRDLPLALAATVSGLDLVTGETVRRGSEELAVIATLPRLRAAGRVKPAERLA